ncbi:hypothetical protein A0O28_0005320 [Trichoderma guizhouense]|uniref:Uncharacterized protein n=1 Tax=Trichoderma guizhouense TaxID=1491466 RepID=A0A1T3CH68_9HYPO|nr:hypothetical protein A0O28_0005320 [Trichoderma guizhouense]
MCDRIASCGPILQVSEERGTCSLVHQSARDYLLREEVDKDPILEEFRIKVKEAHTSLARICLTCIENSDFRHKYLNISDASVLKKSPLLGYATDYWPEHARHADEDLHFSRTFLQEKDDVRKHWWQTYRSGLRVNRHLMEGSRPLHIASFLGIDSLARKILRANAWRISLRFQKYVNRRNIYGITPLILAAHEGHHSVVQLLLANGADVNVCSRHFSSQSWDCTALETAATRGHLNVVQLLLANGADPKPRGNGTALHRAAKYGHEAIVQLLLTYSKGAAGINVQDNLGFTALSEAATYGHEAIVQLLLANGADVNIKDNYEYGGTALERAASGGHKAIVQLLLENGVDVSVKNALQNALQNAVRQGHEAIVQLLLTCSKGTNVNVQDSRGFTALSQAAAYGREAIVRLLLAESANVNIKDKDGCTALRKAAEYGYEAIVQLMLANGADVNIKDKDDCTALRKAARNGHEAIVQLMLANGADVNIKDKDGCTALRKAAEYGHEAIVRVLLANGADVNIKDEDGCMALYIAAEYGHEAIVQLLLENGADNKDDAFNKALAAAASGRRKARISSRYKLLMLMERTAYIYI